MAGTKQIQSARVVVLRLDEAEAEKAAAGLKSLGLAEAVGVTSIAELSVRIADGKVDVLVLGDRDWSAEGLPDSAGEALRPPQAAMEAGIPCLLMASGLSRAATRAARLSGFAAVMGEEAAPRQLYRRIGGLLQRLRQTRPKLA